MTHPSAEKLIEQLNQMGEASRIEAKRGTESGKSILETICAYTNEPHQDGGYILLGVAKIADDEMPSYQAVGVENPEKLKDDISSQCATSFNAVIRPKISEEIVSGKCVLKIFIPEAQNSLKPIYFRKVGLPNGAYRRIGSSDQKCTDEDLQTLYDNRSHKSFDQQMLEGATLDDIDPEAIVFYRQLRKKVSADAEEILWNDTELLQSLHCVTKDPKTGEFIPTVAGIVIFGKTTALRRLFPMLRVDYIRVPGITWISDPDNRFTAVEMRGSLLRLVLRAEAAILDDLPKAFHLPEGELQRQDLPLIPVKVIREALVNTLIHRSYNNHQPIQIIRYSNRLEFRNPGYSLTPEDRLGEPGSNPRNPLIASILHDLNFAESKGSGIRTMIKLMEKHGLTPPALASDRVANNFSAQLLFHHFLSEEDIEWLARFQHFQLSEAQKKALIYIRETEAINNATYRHLNKVDTLEASQQLKELRYVGLVKKVARGNATYYVAGEVMGNSTKLEANTHMPGANTHMLKSNTHMPGANTHMPELPEKLSSLIKSLGKKPKLAKTKEAILLLCQFREMSADEIVSYLQRKDTRQIVRAAIQPLIEAGMLEHTIPESRKHPYQKYRATKKVKS